MRFLVCKRLAFIAAAVSLLAASQNVFAGFTFNDAPGVTTMPTTGDVLDIHVTLWEPDFGTILAGTPQYLFGVGRVDDIIDGTTGQSVWVPTATQGLTFTFNNYVLDQAATSGTSYGFTGGNLDVYFQPNGTGHSISAVQPLGSNSAPDASGQFVNGTPILSMAGAPSSGIDTLAGTFDPTAHDSVHQPAGVNGSGGGTGNLVIMGGTSSGMFANTIMSIHVNNWNNGQTQTTATTTATNYAVGGSDPIAAVANVPEPCSLCLWGSLVGATGIASLRRRWAARA